MRQGLLFVNQHNHSPHGAVRLALHQFKKASHLQGYTAEEARFNPAEKPEEETIAGLTVVADARVDPGRIRITTGELPDLEYAAA